MVWKFAMWLMYISASPLLVKVSGTTVEDDWPYTIKEREYPEQSPVDISTKHAQRRFLPFLRCFGYWAFDRATVKITNNGHTVCTQLTNKTEDVPFITGGPLFDSRYQFEQMHFHWGKNDHGSEHVVNGEKYAMEVHIVHYKKEYGTFENAQNYTDGVCVVGFFGKISLKDNQEMKNFIADLKFITKPKSSIDRSFKEEFYWIKKTALKQHYYTYHGSLTTKPYLECVIWIIFTRPFDISRNQLNSFRKLHSSEDGVLISGNDRDLQPFNNRSIVYAF